MKNKDTTTDNEGSEHSKNAENKKLGDKIGPAKKNDQEREETKEQQDDQDPRSDQKKNTR